jgi:ribonuclease HI
MQPELIIYTDGACKGNPGIGGWAAVLIYGELIKEVSGYVPETTNNRMELTAVIEALKTLKRPCNIAIYTDSQYVKRGMSEWLPSWLKKDFAQVKNPDLWRALVQYSNQHRITWHWVRGHSGDFYNERADELANLAIRQALNHPNP